MKNGADVGAGQTPRAKPESFRGRELSASLTVKDIRNSLAWYRDVVGFTVRKEFERDGVLRAVSLKAGAVAILITQDDGAKGLDRVKGDGFSLRITTAQNIDEVADRIKQRGGVLDSEPADAMGMRVFRLHDPDGFRFVISSEPPAG
jgi:predicted enzyme related to lactoylglutathione lyase